MKLSKTRLARTLLIHMYFWVSGRCIYGWLRCFDVTHCTCTHAHIHFLTRSHVVWMLHAYPGQTLMFSFCWTKPVVSTAGNAVTLLHSAYLLTWLAISISRFTHVHFRIRCYDVTLLQIAYSCTWNLALDLFQWFHTVIFVSDVTLLRCYAVTVHCLSETWLSICISHFRMRCYAVTMLRCYDVTMLRCYNVTLLQCYAVTMLRCYDVTLLWCHTDIAHLLTLSPPCVGTHVYSAIRPWQF